MADSASEKNRAARQVDWRNAKRSVYRPAQRQARYVAHAFRLRAIEQTGVSPSLQAPKRSASSANPSTTMSVARLGTGSSGPAGPHSSGRRTKAVR
jgi:hypothetical protein